MSAFRVYGVSLSHCRRRAERLTNVGDLTMEQWAERVEQVAREIFATSKNAAISPRFSAPQFCYDWIAAAGSDVRAASVRAYKQVGVNEKTGKPKRRWVRWENAA